MDKAVDFVTIHFISGLASVRMMAKRLRLSSDSNNFNKWSNGFNFTTGKRESYHAVGKKYAYSFIVYQACSRRSVSWETARLKTRKITAA